MKTIIASCVVAALALLGTAPSAEAGRYSRGACTSSVYVSGYCSCGMPNYSERYLVGFNCHGQPVWGYRSVNRHFHHASFPARRSCIQPRPYRHQGHGRRSGC